MLTIITSDLHLGSPHCRREDFLAFLERLPAGCTLVLNGDIIDDPRTPLSADDEAALLAMGEPARGLRVLWLRGNHDDGYRPPASISQQVLAEVVLEGLLVTHGDRFDNLMPHGRWFIAAFRALHRWRVRLGAHPVHVAQYAKRWTWLYAVLCRHVRLNAQEHAREMGLTAVTCGHVHQTADQTSNDGVRYLNTGSWTEPDNRVIVLRAGAVQMIAPDALATVLAP